MLIGCGGLILRQIARRDDQIAWPLFSMDRVKNLGGDTDTIGAMATAICGALHGVQAIDLALKNELDAVNRLDFGLYCEKLLHFREQREGV